MASKLMRPVRPSAALEERYLQRLEGLLVQARSELVAPLFKGIAVEELQEGDLALDSFSQADMVRDFVRRFEDWAAHHEDEIASIADWFATGAAKHANNAFKHNLAAAVGHTVNLPFSAQLERQISAVVASNVGLIRSISAVYAEQVADVVMDSVKSGRDLKSLADSLEERFGVSRSRAELIAIDQNNKATAAIDKQRKLDLGITRSKWIHTGAGKDPRPDHMAANGTEYDTEQGCLISGKYVQPGEEVRCHCVSAGVLSAYGEWEGISNVTNMFPLEEEA